MFQMTVAYECVCMRKFWDEIILRGGECKPVKILNFKFSDKKGTKR